MRRTHALKTGVLGVLLVLVSPAAAQAATVRCDAGSVAITGVSNSTSSGGAGLTIERFDFVGLSDMCLGDGRRVTGRLTGSTVQVTNPDGTGTIFVRETLTIFDGSTLGYLILARFGPWGFDGNVYTTSGTGQLSRVVGRGTFFPTGPTTFLSSVVYEYF